MHTSARAAAAHTAADLDAMDDKLRRLGLDVEHARGPAPVSQEQHSSEDYLRRIRATKAEKRQAQFDRVARQAVAAEKHQTASSAGKTAGAPSTEDTTLTDKAILASDTDDAAVRMWQDYQRSTTQHLRADRMLPVAQLQKSQESPPTRKASSFPTAASVSSEKAATGTSTAVARVEARRRAASPWCAEVARGVVELAMEVSDHRHLPSTGLDGRPVYRLQQDLGVTQWRNWVEELVFARAEAVAAAAAQAASAEAAEAARERRRAGAENKAEAARAQAAAAITAVQREAVRCIEAAAQAEAEDAARSQQKAVASVLSRLEVEVARQRRAAEEAVRREADEPRVVPALPAAAGEDSRSSSSSGGGGVGGATLVAVQREEVLPGWAQRMPPAGCLIYGDDLSGARLLSDTIEMCMQRSLYAAQQQHSTTVTGKAAHHNTTHVAATASDPAEYSHRGGQGGDSFSATVSNASFSKPNSTTVDDSFAHFTATDIGVECSDGVDGGIAVTYITPKTLTGTVAVTSTVGDNRRTGSANRSARAQAHSSPGTGATGTLQGSTASSSNAGGGGGGGGSSAVRSGRRASAVTSDGRRSMEQQLAEAAVKELVRVHSHNLGVLAGAKVPAWAPTTTTATTVSAAVSSPPSPLSFPEEAEAPPVHGRPSLRMLFLVGFPDSPSFAEHFAEHLRTATAAAETELLEAEARRQAAELQAAVAAAAAAETGKQRSPSTKSAKGAAAAPSRQKVKASPKTTVETEEGTAEALTEQLRLTYALPPLSVLTVFLSYDVATRQRRLENALVSLEQQQALTRAMGDSAEEDAIAAAAASSDAACDLLHPVYHPWRAEEKDQQPSRTASFRRPLGGSGSGPAAATVAASAAPPPSLSRVLDAWSVPCLRSELEQQDARQQQQRQAWIAAVTAAFVRKPRESTTANGGDLRCVPTSFYAAGKRRDKTTPGTVGQEAERSSQTSRVLSLTIPSAKAVEAGGGGSTAAPASPLTLPSSDTTENTSKLGPSHLPPRVLFFLRVLDVSDVAAPTATAVDAASDVHALGRAVWRSSLMPAAGVAAATTGDAGDGGSPDLPHITARAATVDHILAQLHVLCRPAGGRALASDALLPHQLPEPFRLGDYRLPDVVCQHLRHVHDVYTSLLPEPASVFRVDRATAKRGNDAVVQVITLALQAEAEAWGAVVQYAEDLFALIAFDVFHEDEAAEEEDGSGGSPAFPADGQRTAASVGAVAAVLNSTARFTHIDGSYAQAKDALAQHTSHAVAHIEDCLVLLLRLSLDVCVAQLAAAVQLFCATLDRTSPGGGSRQSRLLSAPEAMENSVGEQLLRSVPRLSETAARRLVSQLQASPTCNGAAAELTASLSQSYWAEVMTATQNTLTQYLEQRAGEQAVAEGVVADAHRGSAGLGTSGFVTRVGTLSIPLDNVASTAALLVEHATSAPTPFHRLVRLLQELQYKTRSLHDGADAWVELLYHDVLIAQSDNSTQKQPQPRQPHRRPKSVDQLADGPQAVVGAGAGNHQTIGDTLQPSRWRCGELEVFLATMPAPDASGLVTVTSFQRGLLKNQLPRVWRFLPDSTTALAAQVQYTISATTASRSELTLRGPSHTAAAPASLPDTALDAYLVHDCACKTSSSMPHVPFLTISNVQCLCAMVAWEDGRPGSANVISGGLQVPSRGPVLHLQQWLIDVALNRCCFCDGGCVSTEAGHRGATRVAADIASTGVLLQSTVRSVPRALFVRYATRHVIRPPSSCAIRQVILSLPASVLEQASALGKETAPSVAAAACGALPLVARMDAGWMQTQWWWMHDSLIFDADKASLHSNAAAQHDVALCWTLWRILLGPSPREGTSTPAAPSLDSLLRLLLVGTAGEPRWREERVRRAFHCLAALRCVRDGSSGTAPVIDDDSNGSDGRAAMAIEDEVALTQDEVVVLGKLLTAPAPAVTPAGSEVALPWGTGASAAAGKGMVELLMDVQLLLQVENVEQVTLPLLLSSRWAQLLLAAHF
jgi:hypothetical protein